MADDGHASVMQQMGGVKEKQVRLKYGKYAHLRRRVAALE